VSLYVRQLQLGPMANFVYLVGAEGSPETAVIDCAWDAQAVLDAVEEDGRTLSCALVSHWHADHTNGLQPLLALKGVPIRVHALDAAELAPELRGEVVPLGAGDAIEVGPLRLRALHTPGHTPGSCCYQLEAGSATGAGAVFSGDTLFVGACGRCDLRGGDPAQMYESLRRLAGLGEEVTLYPGHDYGEVPVSSIGRERTKNPYLLRLGTLEQFVGLRSRPRS
jgi:glyoxylase-like metal-dependent hydrolase (beta-lactamase superfamily II)